MTSSELVRMYAKDKIGDELDVAAESGLHLFGDDPGCRQVELYRRVDDPSCFILKVDWESVEAHTAWVAAGNQGRWRAIVGELRDERTEPLGEFTKVSERP